MQAHNSQSAVLCARQNRKEIKAAHGKRLAVEATVPCACWPCKTLDMRHCCIHHHTPSSLVTLCGTGCAPPATHASPPPPPLAAGHSAAHAQLCLTYEQTTQYCKAAAHPWSHAGNGSTAHLQHKSQARGQHKSPCTEGIGSPAAALAPPCPAPPLNTRVHTHTRMSWTGLCMLRIKQR